jgi:release factor glutamine methyltransferase
MMLNFIENRAQIAASRNILECSAEETAAYDVDILGEAFEVLPGVFSPKYFGSTEIFSKLMPYRQNDIFLEVGCGIGATAIFAAKHGAKRVLAVDINPAAVENTRRNARRHGVTNLEARVSNIFSAVKATETFDTIYWNMPFIYVAESYHFQSMLERALYDPGYQITENFLVKSRRFLRPGGRLMVGFADFGDTNKFFDLAAAAGYEIREIGREDSQEGGPVQFILYELGAKAR